MSISQSTDKKAWAPRHRISCDGSGYWRNLLVVTTEVFRSWYPKLRFRNRSTQLRVDFLQVSACIA